MLSVSVISITVTSFPLSNALFHTTAPWDSYLIIVALSVYDFPSPVVKVAVLVAFTASPTITAKYLIPTFTNSDCSSALAVISALNPLPCLLIAIVPSFSWLNTRLPFSPFVGKTGLSLIVTHVIQFSRGALVSPFTLHKARFPLLMSSAKVITAPLPLFTPKPTE